MHDVDGPLSWPAPKNSIACSFSGLTFELTDVVNGKTLDSVAKEMGVTPFIVALSATMIGLSKYTHQDNFIVALPTLDRFDSYYRQTIGMFTKTILMKSESSRFSTFKEYAQNRAEELHTLMRHRIADYLDCKRKFSKSLYDNPYFNVMFVYDKREDLEISLLNGWSIQNVDLNACKCDLLISFVDQGDNIGLSLNYSSDIFDENEIAYLAQFLLDTFKWSIQHINGQISEFPLSSREIRVLKSSQSNVIPTVNLHEDNPVIRETRDLICSVYSKTLGLESCDDKVSFFDLGGNSLQMLGIHQKIKEKIPHLTLNDLLMHPQPYVLATHLSKLNKAGKKTVQAQHYNQMYFLTPGQLSVEKREIIQGNLARTQVNFINLEDISKQAQSINNMASYCLSTMDGHGSVSVMGWSYTGLVAHNLAEQLLSRGSIVDSIYLLDSFNLSQFPDVLNITYDNMDLLKQMNLYQPKFINTRGVLIKSGRHHGKKMSWHNHPTNGWDPNLFSEWESITFDNADHYSLLNEKNLEEISFIISKGKDYEKRLSA